MVTNSQPLWLNRFYTTAAHDLDPKSSCPDRVAFTSKQVTFEDDLQYLLPLDHAERSGRVNSQECRMSRCAEILCAFRTQKEETRQFLNQPLAINIKLMVLIQGKVGRVIGSRSVKFTVPTSVHGRSQ